MAPGCTGCVAAATPEESGAVFTAALGGFKRVTTHYPDYVHNEYAFFVIGFNRQYVRQIGHEGYMDTEPVFIYTEPTTNHSTDSVDVDIPSGLAQMARAFCHTHPTYGTFSTRDFESFKKLQDLTKRHVIPFNIAFYLLQSDGQVRRSESVDRFWEGALIPGLDKAKP